MKNSSRQTVIVLLSLLLFQVPAITAEPNESLRNSRTAKAAVIICKGMIDGGLSDSIDRRTQIALDKGANYLIYEIDTYGGLVKAAVKISDSILRKGTKAHTVAYITTRAISAGAMISVSCKDIVMRENTTIGDCAPITMGGKLEGTEREKAESFIRGIFERAAEANGYPAALLKAMVTMRTKVYRVKNLQTGGEDFFDADQLPNDPNKYDLRNKKLIVKEDELLTLTASRAFEYGIARAVVKDRAGVLGFLAKRDGVTFSEPPMVLRTSWSEEMVRKINHPAVMGILFMIALLGVYIELNTPGVGLPGLVAVMCFAIIIGSKYLVGLANWIEVASFVVGIILLMVEIFVLPGFGVAGITGIICIMFGLFGMLVKNPPGKLPWPQGPEDWDSFLNGVLGLSFGFVGFVVLAGLFAKYLPKIPIFGRLILATPSESSESAPAQFRSVTAIAPNLPVEVGHKGVSISQLRPSGIARIGNKRLNVVSRGELIEANKEIIVVEIEGNSIVVKEITNPGSIAS